MDDFSIYKKEIKASSVKLVEKSLKRAQSRLHNSDRAHHARPLSSSDIYGPRERKSYMGRGDAVQMDEVKQARKLKNLEFSHPVSTKILEAGLYLIHT